MTEVISLCTSCSEELSEQDDFPEKQLASLVASKVYYHLGSLQDSLTFALGAGQNFNVNGSTEYIETILCECRLLGYLCECVQVGDFDRYVATYLRLAPERPANYIHKSDVVVTPYRFFI